MFSKFLSLSVGGGLQDDDADGPRSVPGGVRPQQEGHRVRSARGLLNTPVPRQRGCGNCHSRPVLMTLPRHTIPFTGRSREKGHHLLERVSKTCKDRRALKLRLLSKNDTFFSKVNGRNSILQDTKFPKQGLGYQVKDLITSSRNRSCFCYGFRSLYRSLYVSTDFLEKRLLPSPQLHKIARKRKASF